MDTTLASTLSALAALSLAPAHAQSLPPTYPDPLAIQDVSGAQQCKSLVVEDYDGDGQLDVAMLTHQQARLWVFRGAGRDGLHTPATIFLPTSSNRMEGGDLNGDGLPDLVVTLFTDDVLVLLGNGRGGFSALPVVAVGDHPLDLRVGDLDGDGDQDVVVALYDDSALAFLSNDGSGALTLDHTEPLPSAPRTLDVGLLDGDTSLDVAVGCFGASSELRVLFNDGTGAFPTSTSLFVGGNMDEIEIADFDGDGENDLSWRSYPVSGSQLQISAGDGLGGFAAATILPFVFDNWYRWTSHGDLDNDGDLDFLVSDVFSVFYVLRNDGGGAYTRITEACVYSSQEGRVVDFDADGNLDLVLGGDNLQIFFGDGQAGFTPEPDAVLPRPPGQQIDAADVDGDGNVDVVVGSFSTAESYVTVAFGDGLGGVSALQDVPLGVDGWFASPATTDWDGDGDPDVLVSYDEGIRVLRNDAGALVVLGTFDAGPGDRRLEGADFDGDGLGDVLVAYDDDHRHTIFTSNGDGTFATHHSVPYANRALSTAVAHLDGDGLLDFVIGTSDNGYNNGKIWVWSSTATGYDLEDVFSYSTGIQHLAAGDLDGDGDADLASLLNYQGGGFVFLNDGNAQLTEGDFLSVDGFAQELRVADMDSDGDADVVAFDSHHNAAAAVFSSKGDGTFLPGEASFIGGINYCDVADVNNDGRPDIVAVYADEALVATGLRLMLRTQAPARTYCSTKVNSQGCAPLLTHSGTPSATAGGGFTVAAENVLSNSAGIFFYGKSGRNAVAFQGGTLCIQPPTLRLPGQFSGGTTGCTGTYATDFNAYVAGGVDPALVAGQQVNGQWWSRDTGFAPPNNTNLTNALELILQP